MPKQVGINKPWIMCGIMPNVCMISYRSVSNTMYSMNFNYVMEASLLRHVRVMEEKTTDAGQC